jgi:hypothetical protein
MNAKIKYTDEPLGKVQVVPDFLPSPAELAFREEGVKVTLALSKKSIEFFKCSVPWDSLGGGSALRQGTRTPHQREGWSKHDRQGAR